MRIWVLGLTLVVFAEQASAEALYEPPDGCEAIATLRLPGCLVRQVSSCANGNIVDAYLHGAYSGRSYYSHPSLFLRYEGADGYVSGHEYGTGTPDRQERLQTDTRYTYSRKVYRSDDTQEAGDTGTEVMAVGQRVGLSVGGKSYRVLDIRFEVSNPDTDFLYRERALMLERPTLTLGVIGTHYNPDGTEANSYSSIPEAISLEGDLGFRSLEPAPSCLPTS